MLKVTAIASGSKGNAYLLDDGMGHKLLLECGVPFPKLLKALDFNLIQLSGCLLTHEHMDHSKAVKDILKHSVTVFASKGTGRALGIDDHWNFKAATEMMEMRIDSAWTFVPLKAEHDAAEPFLYLIKSRFAKAHILFATDTYYIKYKMPETITHICIECNYSMEHLNENIADGVVDASRKLRILHSHMNLSTLKDFFKQNRFPVLQEVYLIHMSNANAEESRMVKEIEELTGVPVTAF
ncbi:MAG: MBL fold metallo-hydrolase [Acidaminococcaceae bacterium]|nr:MBL fold metallo-hydrolase [Acidaminococcaceae bacterium]